MYHPTQPGFPGIKIMMVCGQSILGDLDGADDCFTKSTATVSVGHPRIEVTSSLTFVVLLDDIFVISIFVSLYCNYLAAKLGECVPFSFKYKTRKGSIDIVFDAQKMKVLGKTLVTYNCTCRLYILKGPP